MSSVEVRDPGAEPGVEQPYEQELYAADPGLQPLGPVNATTTPAELPTHVTKRLIGGTSALGMGVLIERGTGFLANILAARLAGAGTFGAYSLAISTANNISTYAAGGIGATAARFSGKYSYEGNNYVTLGRALGIVSLVSAAVAAGALWLGAAPIARLMGKDSLTHLLQWAAISAAGIILLECARGFFVGQRRIAALLLLSVIVATGMLTLLPVAARMHSPIRMITLQGATTTGAVIICLLLAGPLKLRPRRGAPDPNAAPALPLRTILSEVWSFGLVQLAVLVGSNLAGWWLTTLVARTDTTLVQMSFFAIASQLRNLVGIAPSLMTEGSYAVMADPTGEESRTPHRVLALCSFASLAVSLMLAASGIVFAPWLLTLLYGRAYTAAGMTVAVALAIAVVHMGNAPAAARLTIVSIKSTGVINTIWAIFVGAAATLFLFFGGGAWQAMAIYFAGHVLSASLVQFTLYRKDYVPAGMTAMLIFGIVASTLLGSLAVLRGLHPELNSSLTLLMALLLVACGAGIYLFGRRYKWLPSAEALNALFAAVRARLGRRSPLHV